MFQSNSSENLDDDIQIKQESSPDSVQFYLKDEVEYSVDEYEKIFYAFSQFTPFPSNDEPRVEFASSSGGKKCADQKIISCMRSVGAYVIAQIGKKILSGDMNLTKISFPIRAMIAKSALERNLQSTIFFPLYLNRASMSPNPIERLKLVLTATIATFYINLSFLKPLNPILGETLQGSLNDGTTLFAEQISHHPPISQFYGIGPNRSYHYYGYCVQSILLFSNYAYEASSGLNSITLKNRGKRTIRFKDGMVIQYNFAYEVYSGTLMGTTKVETIGKSRYEVVGEDVSIELTFGKEKKKPSDYFSGTIIAGGQEVCKMYGSYMGFLEFDGIRYWDYRYVV